LRAAAGSSNVPDRGVCVGEDGGDVFEEQSPRTGECDVTARALEERDTEFSFEHFDVPADRWLREMQPFGGSTEMKFFGDSLKATGPLNIEVHPLIVRDDETRSIAICY